MRATPRFGWRAALAASAAISGGAAAATIPGAARAEDATLGVIGDSLTWACRLIAPAQLAAAGWGRVTIDGHGSRRIPESAPAPYSGVKALRAMREGGFDAAAFVIELGTNDVGYAAKYGQDLRTIVLEMLDAIGPGHRVLWVDVVRHDIRRAVARFDDLLDEVAAARSGQLVVYHWSRIAIPNPDWFQDDGIHLTEEGCAQRARLVAQASVALRLTAGAPAPAKP